MNQMDVFLGDDSFISDANVLREYLAIISYFGVDEMVELLPKFGMVSLILDEYTFFG